MRLSTELDEYYDPYRPLIGTCHTPLEKVVLYKLLLDGYLASHAESTLFVNYDELTERPKNSFARLGVYLDLDLDARDLGNRLTALTARPSVTTVNLTASRELSASEHAMIHRLEEGYRELSKS